MQKNSCLPQGRPSFVVSGNGTDDYLQAYKCKWKYVKIQKSGMNLPLSTQRVNLRCLSLKLRKYVIQSTDDSFVYLLFV